jgi:hypothetical protein
MSVRLLFHETDSRALSGPDDIHSAAAPSKPNTNESDGQSAGVEDLLTDLTLDDLNGTEDDDAVIEALTVEDTANDERARKAEAARRARLRSLLQMVQMKQAGRWKSIIGAAIEADDGADTDRTCTAEVGKLEAVGSTELEAGSKVEILEAGDKAHRALASVPLAADAALEAEPSPVSNLISVEELLSDDLTLDDLSGTDNDAAVIEELTDKSAALAPVWREEAGEERKLSPAMEAIYRDRRKKEERRREKEERRLPMKIDRRNALNAERQRRFRAKKQALLDETSSDPSKAIAGLPDQLDTIPTLPPIPRRYMRQYYCRVGLLQAATASPGGDKFLISIRGREVELTYDWVFRQIVEEKFGIKASDSKVARLHPDKSMTKRRVQSQREIAAKLQAPGRPWHGL